MEYICKPCNIKYYTQSGLWKHKNKITCTNNDKIFDCKHCTKTMSSRQSKWRHEKICKNNNTTNTQSILEQRITQLEFIVNGHNTNLPDILDKQICLGLIISLYIENLVHQKTTS